MRVDPGVAVAGEVLGGCDRAVVLDAPHEGGAQHGDLVRILADCPHVDDGILRVVVDVEDRREGHVDADRPPLQRGHAAHLVGHPRVPGGAERHERGEAGRAAEPDVGGRVQHPVEAEARAGLQVGADKQGQLRERLEPVELRGDLDGRAHRDDDAADLVLLDQRPRAPPGSRPARREVADQDGHHQLGDLLLEAEGFQRLFRPAAAIVPGVAGGVEAVGGRDGGGGGGRRRAGGGVGGGGWARGACRDVAGGEREGDGREEEEEGGGWGGGAGAAARDTKPGGGVGGGVGRGCWAWGRWDQGITSRHVVGVTRPWMQDNDHWPPAGRGNPV